MQQIPKIVRERLRATSVSHHPDAGLLTAFSERSLPDLERGVVLEHLARCAECRDVVALSLPEIEVAAPAVQVRSGWMSWPTLRWGFVAAGTLAVALFGTLEYQRSGRPEAMIAGHPRPEVEARLQSPPPASAVASRAEGPDQYRSNAAPGFLPKDTTKAEHLNNRAESSSQTIIPQVGGHKATVALPGGPKRPTQWQQQIAPAAQLPVLAMPAQNAKQMADMGSNAGVPSSSQSVKVQVSGAAPAILMDQTQIAQTQIAQAQPPSVNTLREIDRAKAPVPNASVANAAVTVEADGAAPLQSTTTNDLAIEMPVQRNVPLNARNFTQLVAVTATPAALRWTISSTGSLQRSFDQGTTWQEVDVNANSASAGGALAGAEVVSNNTRAKAQSTDKKTASPPALIFRAVTATGPDVWAGGVNGALYHSVDSGTHWIRVLPASAGIGLTGDILSLQFADVQHGRILTSTAETWTTADDGQTWQKR
jgi:hypothetical protein